MRINTITEETIRQLVDGFYSRIRKDALLSPVFEKAIGSESKDWQPHLEKMYDFWSSIMLASGRYRGNPLKKHKDLPAFDIHFFDRWLELFAETACELHSPDIAARYIEKSELIAKSLKYGLYSLDKPRFSSQEKETKGAKPALQNTYFTIGHSTRSTEDVIALLKEAGADMIADVRSIPRSRTNPQFNQDVFPAALAREGIGYQYFKALGGLRGKSKDGPSPNTFWENKSFRNYADYTATKLFQDGIEELLQAGKKHICAIMCAEAVWWRCHRRIISDYLILRGMKVFHIMGSGKIEAAILNPAATQTDNGILIYKGEPNFEHKE